MAIKKINNRNKKLMVSLLKILPRKKTLKGSLIHKILGERLFDKNLWKPSVYSVSNGFALGIFIGVFPIYGFQIITTIIFCFIFRVNIVAACAGTFISNPLTVPFILYVEYKIGNFLLGINITDSIITYDSAVKNFIGKGKAILIGSTVCSFPAALFGKIFIKIFWDIIRKIGLYLFKKLNIKIIK